MIIDILDVYSMPYLPKKPTTKKFQIDRDIILSDPHSQLVKTHTDASVNRLQHFISVKFDQWKKIQKQKTKQYSAEWFSITNSSFKLKEKRGDKWIFQFKEDSTHYHYPTDKIIQIWTHKSLPIIVEVHTYHDKLPKPATRYILKLLKEEDFVYTPNKKD